MSATTITFLKNKEIDREKWDYRIENSCNGTLYAMSWYLDAVAEHWDALVAGDYETVFPITYVKKLGMNILYTPDCVQQLGIFSQQQPSDETLTAFLKAIPKKFLFGKLQLNSGNILTQNGGFQINNRVNIELDIRSSIDVLRKNYGRNITENLRKVRKNKVYIRESVNFRNTIETYRANKGKDLYYTGEKYYKSAYKLMETLTVKQLLVIHEACNAEGNVIAGIIAAPFKNKIVLMQLGCNTEGYRTGATSLLVDSILARFAEKKEICDFEGSNTESVAYFYAGFGGHIVPYPEVTIENIPKAIIKMMFKVKLKFTKFLFIVFLSLFALYSNGQTKVENPYSIGEITKFDYKAYLKLKEMDSIYYGSDMERNYNELISVLESRYGKYIESADRMEQYWVKSKQNLTEHFPNIEVVPMSNIMDSLISHNQVTMINEIHDQPVFRAIAHSFLEICYKNGYRYFAVEALKRTDGTLNKRKYPLLYETGFYTDEPVFGDLLRQAMNMGYTLVPYDTFPAPSSSINRDQGEALNIINKTIAKDSTAKILVLGGMGHIFDKEGFNTMGYYFKEYSDIDPLTIDFLYFKPHFNKEDEREAERYFLDIADNLDRWEPFFLYDTTRKQFRGMGTDFIGMIPRTVFVTDDIPSWKIFNGKVIYRIDKSFLQKHNIKKSLVSAFLEKEGEKSVPIDQIEIQDTNKDIALVLYKGQYLLHFDDGETVKKFKITVK